MRIEIMIIIFSTIAFNGFTTFPVSDVTQQQIDVECEINKSKVEYLNSNYSPEKSVSNKYFSNKLEMNYTIDKNDRVRSNFLSFHFMNNQTNYRKFLQQNEEKIKNNESFAKKYYDMYDKYMTNKKNNSITYNQNPNSYLNYEFEGEHFTYRVISKNISNKTIDKIYLYVPYYIDTSKDKLYKGNIEINNIFDYLCMAGNKDTSNIEEYFPKKKNLFSRFIEGITNWINEIRIEFGLF